MPAAPAEIAEEIVFGQLAKITAGMQHHLQQAALSDGLLHGAVPGLAPGLPDALDQARAEHLPGVAEQRRRAVAVQQLIAGQDHLPQQEHGEPVGDNLAPDRRVTAVAGHHLLDPAGAVIGPRQQPAGLPAVTGKPGQPVKDPLRPALPLGVAAGRAR